MFISSYRIQDGINALMLPVTSSTVGATLRTADSDIDLWVLHHDKPGNLINKVRLYAVVGADTHQIGPNDQHIETLVHPLGTVRHVFEIYQP